MSQFEKAWEKFNRVPVPKDITIDDLKYITEHFGMTLETGGGKHGVRLRYRELGIKIPIPIHGNNIKAVYVLQVKNAIKEIENHKKE